MTPFHETGIVIGWKLYGNGVPWWPNKKPKFLEVSMMSPHECASKFKQFKSLMTDSNFCAGGVLHDNDKDCIESRGSPIVTHDDVLIGIAYGFVNCSKPDTPILYITVSKFRSWIDDNI